MTRLPFIRVSPALTTEDKLAVASVAEVRKWSRLDFDVEDDIIAFCIESAYDWLTDRYLNGCRLLTETFEVSFAGIDAGSRRQELPLWPVLTGSLERFDYLSGGSYIAMPETAYGLEMTDLFPLVTREGYGSWPFNGLSTSRAYRLQFKAGFGQAPDIPTNLRHAIRLLAKHFYDNREVMSYENRSAPLTNGIRYGLADLCSTYRVTNDHS